VSRHIPPDPAEEWTLTATNTPTPVPAPAPTQPRPRLIVRQAVAQDIDAIIALGRKIYPDFPPYSRANVQGQISEFPEGQLVAVYGSEIVGHAASFRIAETVALAPHTWAGITGGGFASRHDPAGDWLYGMDVSVDPAWRGRRVGQRLYDARRQLVERLELRGIAFGARIPTLARRVRQHGSPEAYLAALAANKARDPVVSFQIGNGFEPIGVLKGYWPEDADSLGYAAHMVWRNPYAIEQPKTDLASARPKDWVRVACVQFQQRAVESFEAFMASVEYYVDVTSDYRADFVVFPELFTLQLLAFESKRLGPVEAIERLTQHTEPFVSAMRDLAVRYNINIIGGSHPTRARDGRILNVAYVFLRDGTVHSQEKLHPTPSERSWWGIEGGDDVRAIETDCGVIGVLICYDSEFPELARRLADAGARILFVPFCTDNRQGYLRVRYCSAARAIENQCYVALSGNVGNLPNVENMDIQYAQSCILTPSDFPFARDGVAAEATENVEMVTVADLDLSNLNWARLEGTVRNLKDRRFDLYRVAWRDD
jgi:predicted amidohydrolase/GNAT superfamily N-acetyltransferase